VVGNTSSHSYEVGVTYTVDVVDDSDSTLRAKDEKGRTPGWVPWRDCEPAIPRAWDLIAADLPEDLILFLSCFDGISRIDLKEPIIDAILASLPDLQERVVGIARTAAGAAMIRPNMPRSVNAPSGGPS